MRTFTHTLVQSKTKKSVILQVEIDDRFGKKVVNFSSVVGWRKDLALKYLSSEPQESNEEIARTYVGLQALKCAREKQEGLAFLNIVNSLTGMELFFWSNKFLTSDKAKKAWRSLYG